MKPIIDRDGESCSIRNGEGAVKLTAPQLRVLRLLADGVRYPDFPTTVARQLEAMGLAEKCADDKGGYFHFRITALGREGRERDSRN